MATEKSISFPTDDDLFNMAFNALCKYLTVLVGIVHNYERLALDKILIYDPLMADLMKWNDIYAPEKTKGSKNSTLKKQKDSIKNHALGIIRPTRIGLKMTDQINPGFLTDEDKIMFYIDDPNARTSREAPTEKPQITIEEIMHLEHLLRIVDKDHPKSRALPPSSEKIELRRHIGTTAPTSEDQYLPYASVGKFHVVSTFTVADANKVCWYIARFVNFKGEPGEWSAAISCTIAAIGGGLPDFPTPTPVPVTPITPVTPTTPTTT